MSSKEVIYLGGPIAGCTDAEMHGRRNYLKIALSDKYDFLDPSQQGLFAEGIPADKIVEMDKELIQRSDIVAIDAWKTSVGTAMEMMYAFSLGKFVLMIYHGDPAKANPWYQVHSSVLVNSLDDARFYLHNRVALVEDTGFDFQLNTVNTDNGVVIVSPELTAMARDLDRLCQQVHTANRKWWINLETGEPIQRNFGEMLMLVTSELAEALEGNRKGLQDDHLPGRRMDEVEIMDAFIRLMDIVAGLGMSCEAWAEKMAYNAVRADHKTENRLAAGGKKY